MKLEISLRNYFNFFNFLWRSGGNRIGREGCICGTDRNTVGRIPTWNAPSSSKKGKNSHPGNWSGKTLRSVDQLLSTSWETLYQSAKLGQTSFLPQSSFPDLPVSSISENKQKVFFKPTVEYKGNTCIHLMLTYVLVNIWEFS